MFPCCNRQDNSAGSALPAWHSGISAPRMLSVFVLLTDAASLLLKHIHHRNLLSPHRDSFLTNSVALHSSPGNEFSSDLVREIYGVSFHKQKTCLTTKDNSLWAPYHSELHINLCAKIKGVKKDIKSHPSDQAAPATQTTQQSPVAIRDTAAGPVLVREEKRNMCTLRYVLWNMENWGRDILRNYQICEQKQVEWKRAWSYYADATYRWLFMCTETHCYLYILRNKFPWVLLIYHTKKKIPVFLNYIWLMLLLATYRLIKINVGRWNGSGI